MPSVQPFSIPEVLRTGISGLCFLLAGLSYLLIRAEQKREGLPRKGILHSIYVLMGLSVVFSGIVFFSVYMGNGEARDGSSKLNEQVAQLTTERDKARETESKLNITIAKQEGELVRLSGDSKRLSEAQDTVAVAKGILERMAGAIQGKETYEVQELNTPELKSKFNELRRYLDILDAQMKKAAEVKLIGEWRGLTPR